MTETGTALEVIFGRCEKTATGCWEYVKGYHLREGYGQLTYEGKQQPTHRIVWQETNGPIPDGMVVCHHCDNPPCSGALKVSPQMLEAMWGIAAAQGKDSALEVGHPTKDVLRVDGKTVAWSAKPQSRVSA